MQQYMVLLPELLILAVALVALFADLLGGDRAAAILGAAATGLATVLVWFTPTGGELFYGQLNFAMAPTTLVLRSAIAGLTCLFLVWVAARGWAGAKARTAVSLVLFSTVGSMLLVSSVNLVVIFMALELATLPLYVLVGYARNDRLSLEGSLKYFLLSMLASLIMAYGMSFAFGLTGTTDYAGMDLASKGLLGYVAAMLIVAGFLAKLTAAPFHFWSPDALSGAPVPSAAFVSSVGKIAPLWALVLFVANVLGADNIVFTIMMIVSILSMILGNLGALPQTDIRRMLAYSGIANAGYMLLGVSAATNAGLTGAVLFVVVYATALLGQLLVVAQEGPTLSDVAGLVKTRPYAAWCSVAFLFSLIGFPPLAGFYGKLIVFSAAMSVGNAIAAWVAILMSVVSAGYAFTIIRAMFTPGEGAPEMIERDPIEVTSTYKQRPLVAAGVILTLTLLVIGLGIATEPLAQLIGAALP